jgi:hypothetical protein
MHKVSYGSFNLCGIFVKSFFENELNHREHKGHEEEEYEINQFSSGS